MGWSREGADIAKRLVNQLACEDVGVIIHSGARRTSRLAQMVARRTGCPVHADARWLERDFGAWEGRSWDAIWRETGDLMDRMVTDPTGFRPGGGETGLELSLRAQAALNALPALASVLVITHGGPIAALRTCRACQPLERMIDFVPGTGEIVVFAREASVTNDLFEARSHGIKIAC
jgi:broad specificity phosphatase PhoE